jgi:hypothetical protein
MSAATDISPQILAEARAAGRRVPDFWIVGHPKSGTTALYEMLRRHPQVFMPELKEPLYLAREMHPGLVSPRHPDTLEQYLALFAPARPDQKAGEASPSYLRSPLAAARIRELQPDARIIAVLREPASFLRSVHLELLQDHVETEKDFRKAIAREQRQIEEKPVVWYAPERVEYVEHLRRYHEIFAPEQVLVLIYDDFRADNEGTMRRVLRFLDVDEQEPIAPTEANPTVSVGSVRMYELMRRVYLGRGSARVLNLAIKTVTSQRIRRSALELFRTRVVYGKPPPPDEELMLELRRRFKPHVVAVSEYLGRDLVSLWGYDELD